jgi:hypothetical protein
MEGIHPNDSGHKVLRAARRPLPAYGEQTPGQNLFLGTTTHFQPAACRLQVNLVWDKSPPPRTSPTCWRPSVAVVGAVVMTEIFFTVSLVLGFVAAISITGTLLAIALGYIEV